MKSESDSKEILRKLIKEVISEIVPGIVLPPELQQPQRPAYVSHVDQRTVKNGTKSSESEFKPVKLPDDVNFSTIGRKWEPSKSFIEYIKRVENLTKVGKNKSNGRWYPIMDPNGQFQVIGYGHKVEKSDNRRFSTGITDSEVEKLLIADLLASKQKVDAYLKSKKVDPSTLSEHQLEMLIDFAFNGVLYKFPKFVAAVVANNQDAMKREHVRKFRLPNGKVKEMVGRNKEFRDRYLS